MQKSFESKRITGAEPKLCSRFLFKRSALASLGIACLFAILGTATGCSILQTRPTQEMNDTSAAIKAAKEVQADTITPELYRQANDWFNKAKREYKFKNFSLAREYAEKARRLAEVAEFESIRSGGNRTDISPPPPPPPPPPAPSEYAAPTGTPADRLDPGPGSDTPPKP